MPRRTWNWVCLRILGMLGFPLRLCEVMGSRFALGRGRFRRATRADRLPAPQNSQKSRAHPVELRGLCRNPPCGLVPGKLDFSPLSRRRSQVVRQRSAKPPPAVRIRPAPLPVSPRQTATTPDKPVRVSVEFPGNPEPHRGSLRSQWMASWRKTPRRLVQALLGRLIGAEVG